MVDRTTYADEAHTPKIALRQIFGRQNLPSALCLSAANAGLLSVEVFAMLGDTAQAAKDQLRALIPADELGADQAARALALMQLAAVWLACQALQTQFAARRARMEEDPAKVPEMPQEDHAEFRARFVRTHPDVILLDGREPHKKFVEKLSRDFLVHGMVPFYTAAEIRTRADTIIQKAGLSKNAEDLLTVSKAEEPDSVTDVQTLLNRLHAFFMALEYLNICPYSRATGPLMYLQQLEQFRAECPGLPFVLMADTLIRKKVFRLQAEQRDAFATFQAALLDVLTNHRYLWNDARTKATLASNEVRKDMEQSQSDRTRVRSPDKTPSSKAARRKRARERQREAMVGPAHKQARPAQEAVRPTLDKDKRIPESEWKAINSAAQKVQGAKRCHYFNSTMGCSAGDKCRFKHACMVCGAAHSMVGNH